MSQIDDFFRSRLDQMIDLRKPLAVLATHISWQELEAAVAHRFARQVRTGKEIADVDLFGPTVAVVGGGGFKRWAPAPAYAAHDLAAASEKLLETKLCEGRPGSGQEGWVVCTRQAVPAHA